MTIKKQIDTLKNKMESNTSKLQKAIFLELSKRVIDVTPVDTGRARANWQAEINQTKKGLVESFSAESASNKALLSVSRVLEKHSTGDKLVLNNNVAYIRELDQGSSKQAPNGIVDVARANFNSISNIEVRRL